MHSKEFLAVFTIIHKKHYDLIAKQYSTNKLDALKYISEKIACYIISSLQDSFCNVINSMGGIKMKK